MLKCLNVKIKKTGFTLMEAIVAIFLITVGIVGTYALITMTISSATISKDKLVAAYLAQEGIEIVRNIRDTNWLDPTNPPWNDGLGTGDWQADYNDQDLSPYTENPLNLETATGLYGYDFGTPTKFKRKITIAQPEAYILGVSVLVEWQEKGTIHRVSAQENLYNWR